MAQIDWTNPGSIGKALNEKKHFLFGLVAVVAVVVIVVLFVRGQRQDAAYEPWRALMGVNSGDPKMPWQMTSEELEQAQSAAASTDAEAHAIFWHSLELYDSKEKQRSLETLQRLYDDHGESYLLTVAAPVPRDPQQQLPIAARINQDLQRYEEASAANPVATENPLPSDRRTVTLVTENGDRIQLTLLRETSPESCRAFARIASQLEGSTIALALPGAWVELGLDEGGETWPLDDQDEPFPPYEENDAYHFEGSVAFRQAPFREGPFDRGLKIWLEDDFRSDGVSTVFAQVTAGLDVLQRLSEAEKDEQRATLIQDRVVITSVELDVGDLAPSEEPEAGDDDAAEDGDAGGDDSTEGSDDG